MTTLESDSSETPFAELTNTLSLALLMLLWDSVGDHFTA